MLPLCLFLLAAAFVLVKAYEDPWTNTNSTVPIKDLLDTTRCYCADPHDDKRFSFYYHFDYYNFNMKRWYAVEHSCDSREFLEGHRFDNFNPCLRKTDPFWCDEWEEKPKICMPKCLQPWNNKELRSKKCDHDADGNKFCYKIREDRERVSHKRDTKDVYWFNGQKRKTSLFPVYQGRNETEKICDQVCANRFSGSERLQGTKMKDWTLVVSPYTHQYLWSRIKRYYDNDNMCHGCP